MQFSSKAFKTRLKAAMDRERGICRVIAAWCLYAMIILLKNEGNFFDLSFAQGESTAAMVLLILLFFAALTAVAVLLPAYETDSWFLLLGATACVIRWLSTFENDISYRVTVGKNTMTMNSDHTLFLLAVIFAYSLFLFYFLQKNDLLIDRLQIHSKAAMGIAVALGLLGGTVIAVTTCMRYLTFTSPNFDFGLFVNMFHNMKETGLPLVSSERDVLLSHFVVHLSPIYYLLLPIYALFPSPMTLQISQAVLVTSGILPAILLARHFKLSERAQLLVAVIYAFYPATSMGCFYDFHENCFLLPLLLWVFYLFEREKYLPMYVFAALTLMVKEDAAVYILFFALFIIFALLYWVSMSRQIRGQILSLKEQEYVLAAKSTGASAKWVIRKHLLPNCISVVVISTALQIPSAIFTESYLSFLGLGVNAPMPSLGSLASDALNGITSYPYRLVIPAVTISLIVLSLNLFGDGLRDAFDPKLKN